MRLHTSMIACLLIDLCTCTCKHAHVCMHMYINIYMYMYIIHIYICIHMCMIVFNLGVTTSRIRLDVQELRPQGVVAWRRAWMTVEAEEHS